MHSEKSLKITGLTWPLNEPTELASNALHLRKLALVACLQNCPIKAVIQRDGYETSVIATANSLDMDRVMSVCVILVPKQQTVSNLHRLNTGSEPQADTHHKFHFHFDRCLDSMPTRGFVMLTLRMFWKMKLNLNSLRKRGSKMVLGLKPSLKDIQGWFSVSGGLT